MSQMTLEATDTMTPDAAPAAKPFRFPNPLRSGAVSFVTTLVVAGSLLALFNVAMNRGIDAYYGKQLAVFATPPTDPAFAVSRELAKADDSTETNATATVSAN